MFEKIKAIYNNVKMIVAFKQWNEAAEQIQDDHIRTEVDEVVNKCVQFINLYEKGDEIPESINNCLSKIELDNGLLINCWVLPFVDTDYKYCKTIFETGYTNNQIIYIGPFTAVIEDRSTDINNGYLVFMPASFCELSDERLGKYALAHEIGHVVMASKYNNDKLSNDLKTEIEADKYAYSIMNSNGKMSKVEFKDIMVETWEAIFINTLMHTKDYHNIPEEKYLEVVDLMINNDSNLLKRIKAFDD